MSGLKNRIIRFVLIILGLLIFYRGWRYFNYHHSPTEPGRSLNQATPLSSAPIEFPGRLVDESPPTLVDFWVGRATFEVELKETGLPMGESDTILMDNGELWSYLHASHQTIGVVDRCGDVVPFPGCIVIYRSYDDGKTFQHEHQPSCQFDCERCPCQGDIDHINQQQYPRVFQDGQAFWLVYEYRGQVMLRRSVDGLAWSEPERIAQSGHWNNLFRYCRPSERIGTHPFASRQFRCLAGGPPGIYVTDNRIYVFMAIGQSPGAMGCYSALLEAPGEDFEPCRHNPLFIGSPDYGPQNEKGPETNLFFDFRTISAAEVQKIGQGDEARFYMLYEGIRGPGPGDPGDSQFGLGLARSLTNEIDGPWEKFPDNPILVDLVGNVGLGHSDLVTINGQTWLYTSVDGVQRSRLALVWRQASGVSHNRPE